MQYLVIHISVLNWQSRATFFTALGAIYVQENIRDNKKYNQQGNLLRERSDNSAFLKICLITKMSRVS